MKPRVELEIWPEKHTVIRVNVLINLSLESIITGTKCNDLTDFGEATTALLLPLHKRLGCCIVRFLVSFPPSMILQLRKYASTSLDKINVSAPI